MKNRNYFWAVILDIFCRIFFHRLWLLNFAAYAKNYCNHSLDFCYLLKVIGDEMHFLLGCPKFVSERGRLFYDHGQLYGLRNNGDFLTFNLLMNHGFGDTHMAGKILKYVNECFNTWERKSWSEIIYVTTTGFCIGTTNNVVGSYM